MTRSWLIGVLALCVIAPTGRAADDYRADIEAWRAKREARLKADDGWLTLGGLFFLKEGESSFGSGPLNDIVLREGPTEAGVFTYRDRKVSVRAMAGHNLPISGMATTHTRLYPFEGRRPTITIGHLSLFVHLSGKRLAIRMRDQDSVIRREFKGLRWFPVDDRYRVKARFIPHRAPRIVRVQNILGDMEAFTSTGAVTFSLGGKELRMMPVDSGGQLWFIFRDMTSGAETYQAARFLYADAPADGWTAIDFNKAYSPPCAFNPYTTCPLPPPENRLRLRIEAGEMTYHATH